MNKLILICLLFVIPTALGQDCDNPLLLALDLGDVALDTPTAQTGLSYCTENEGLDLCCTAATINTLQTIVNTIITETVIQAAARDTYLLTLQTAVQTYTTTYASFQVKAIAALAAVVAEIAEESTPELVDLEEAVSTYILSSTEYLAVLAAATEGFEDYQTARATCADAIIEAQASIYCLACRSDYATFTVSGTTAANAELTFDTDFETAIGAACYPYFNAATTQNILTQYYLMGANLAAANTLLDAITSNPSGTTTAAALTTALEVDEADIPTNNAQEFPTVGMNCGSAAGCTFAYEILLNNGVVLDTSILANGGFVEEESSRLLAESRMLQTSYNPADYPSGTTVEFPADVIAAAASGWRQGGLMTCVVALVAMLLF